MTPHSPVRLGSASSPSAASDVDTAPRTSARWWALGVGASLLLGAVALAWPRLQPTATLPSVVPVAAAPSAAAGSTSAGAASDVTIAFESDPAGAHVAIDGVEQGVTPLSLTLPRGEAPLAVTLTLEGYTPLERTLVPDLDQRVVVSLIGAPRPSSGRARRARPETAGPVTASPPAATEPEPERGRGFRRFDK